MPWLALTGSVLGGKNDGIPSFCIAAAFSLWGWQGESFGSVFLSQLLASLGCAVVELQPAREGAPQKPFRLRQALKKRVKQYLDFFFFF